ncbi:MAG TPA: hypothetical protein VGQ38_15520 [Gaiellaceae bacterium]|nr:hypothetical protein [Gaiellaceae bacterium]
MKTTPAAKTTGSSDQSEQALLYRLVRELPLADVLRALAAKEPTP